MLTLTTLSAQIADGALSGAGSIGLESAPKGNLLTQFQQLPRYPFNYTGQGRAAEVQLIPFLSMFVPLPEYLSDGIGHLSGNAKFSGTSTDLSNFNIDSEIALTQMTLNAVVLEDSRLNCTIAAGQSEGEWKL